MMSLKQIVGGFVCLAGVVGGAAPQLPVTAKVLDDRVRIEVDGALFTEIRTEGFQSPILWPIQGPGDVRMTRDWPVKEGSAGESKDHPHHKGLWVGLENMSGANFWHDWSDHSGKVVLAKPMKVSGETTRAVLNASHRWEAKDGTVLATEERTWAFSGTEAARVMDLTMVFSAGDKPFEFVGIKDGFLGLRTHPHLRLTANKKKGAPDVFGKAVNSEGITGKAVWGKRADWVHYSGPVEGKPVGIAVINHPKNPSTDPGGKAWWHARDYGLIAVNPFAPEKIGGDGSTTLAPGKSLTLRYRLVFHSGEADVAQVQAWAKAFLK